MKPEAHEQWVWVARIRRAQGRKGEVFCEILTDFPEKFAERRQLFLLSAQESACRSESPARAVQLIHHWMHKGGIVLHFAGVDCISDAELLTGMMVAIPRQERAPLAEDAVYIADLVGCTLVDVANPAVPSMVGEIEDVDRTAGPVPILVVRSAKGEVLIPFAKDYLRRIDLEAKRVEMALPEGLADLNAER